MIGREPEVEGGIDHLRHVDEIGSPIQKHRCAATLKSEQDRIGVAGDVSRCVRGIEEPLGREIGGGLKRRRRQSDAEFGLRRSIQIYGRVVINAGHRSGVGFRHETRRVIVADGGGFDPCTGEKRIDDRTVIVDYQAGQMEVSGNVQSGFGSRPIVDDIDMIQIAVVCADKRRRFRHDSIVDRLNQNRINESQMMDIAFFADHGKHRIID